MKFSGLVICFLMTGFLATVVAFKPVVILHGILSGSESMMSLQRFIESQHPGTKVYNCDLFSNWYSLENAWKQVSQFRDYLEAIQKLHPEGIIVIGYSQGGLLARATIQSMPNHNVKVFISLSSPQAGQYGTSFLHLIFPDLAAKTAFELFYSKVGQHTSVGNYWNDPNKQDLYLKYSVFLPYINNELKSTNSSEFKNALTHLDKMVLIGGPNDGVITPWESSHFGFYNGSFDVVPFNKRDIYTADTIGLKTLADHGKLIIIVKPFVHHLTWHTNKRIIKEVILPHLN
ncbi:lysosomal thioesterase PPT2 homolog [Lucilia sericata]|uniref:lysosomal thioesterase PPT2 homolog n=1 Tax=Lucilia sericata TaxID=13632 RepID=UPI0018A8784E|nr:lysosomal thioesterase PPT2 homolog [Lucilia sericata]